MPTTETSCTASWRSNSSSDLHRRDVFSAADDDVLRRSVADLDIPVGMHHCPRPRYETIHRRSPVCFDDVVEIALHHDVPANADFPKRLPVAGHFLTGRVQRESSAELTNSTPWQNTTIARSASGKFRCSGSSSQMRMKRAGSLGQAIDVRDIPTQPALDEFDGDGSRQGSRQSAAAQAYLRRACSNASGALAIPPISTVGAAQREVTASRSTSSKISVGSTLRRQTCTEPRAVTVHTKVHPLA